MSERTVTCTCAGCGLPFSISRSEFNGRMKANKSGRLFCGHRCRTLAPSLKKQGKGTDAALARRRKRSERIDLSLTVAWGDGGPCGDDFAVTTKDGYMLRVEQTDNQAWWWQVYYPGGGENDMADPWCDLTVPTEYIAKRMCELVYRLHSRVRDAQGLVPPQEDRATASPEQRGPEGETPNNINTSIH